MQYHVPRLELGARLGLQTQPADKVGGLPFGVEPHAWPSCADCGGAMSPVAQFVHHPDRLDLGAAARILTLWQCEHSPGECRTWSPTSGANAATITDASRASLPTPPPAPAPVIFGEARVTGWVTADDGAPPERDDEQPEGGDPARDLQWPELDEATRLGGAPIWLQGVETPGPTWRYVGMLHYPVVGHTPAPTADEVGMGINRRTGGSWQRELPAGADASDVRWLRVDEDEGRWFLDGAVLGDAGAGYVFLEGTGEGTRAAWLWQC